MSDSSITHTVSAFFDKKNPADTAIDKLVDAGINRSAITLSEGPADGKTADRAVIAEESKGFWDTLESFFFPDDDRHVYAEGLRRGGYLVTVSGLTLDQRKVAANMLDAEGSVDLHERAEGWRADGWKPTPREFINDTSDFANRTFDQSDGTLVGGNVDDAFHSGRDDRDTADNEESAVVSRQNGSLNEREINPGNRRVRTYASPSPARLNQPHSPDNRDS
jgi:hypothetical protein